MLRSPNRTMDLRGLNAFAVVARRRSFRGAAQELRVSVSTLSVRLRDLETLLGVRLLNRTTRSVAPTVAGERLLARVEPALRELTAATSEVGDLRDAPSGRLRINSPAPATQLVLAPMIAPFLRRYPEISLEIVDEASLIDIVKAGYDAGVRYEENLAKDMVAVSLGSPQRYVVVAAPAFLDDQGRPKTPKDLLGAPCITTRFPSGVVLPWGFEKSGRKIRIQPSDRLSAANTAMQLRAAEDGVGFYLTFEDYAASGVAAGTLEVVLSDWCPSFPGPLLYYHSRRQNPSCLTAFVAFVKEWRNQERRARRR